MAVQDGQEEGGGSTSRNSKSRQCHHAFGRPDTIQGIRVTKKGMQVHTNVASNIEGSRIKSRSIWHKQTDQLLVFVFVVVGKM